MELKDAPVFSVDVNEIPRLAVVAIYCDSQQVREEMLCLKPMHGTTKGEDVAKAFTDHFEKRCRFVKNIFAITTDRSPTMVGKPNGFAKLTEEKIGHPVVKCHYHSPS